ncbi:uncharacterized protein PSFLO_00878 [Pseudozyma flocculosa]|uniref:Secreted protein n=1 Tax=Pseudozyma flocculosa TaxID=84751 RepID=A0A5C3EV97_9BASI|nr:uncharacterized protein PSFLO_00878 [Pseudozyma flocculosa]
MLFHTLAGVALAWPGLVLQAREGRVPAAWATGRGRRSIDISILTTAITLSIRLDTKAVSERSRSQLRGRVPLPSGARDNGSPPASTRRWRQATPASENVTTANAARTGSGLAHKQAEDPILL